MKRLPIKIAREVAQANGLRQVILCAWDGERTHIVTYGKSVEDCAQAAAGGNRIKEALGWPKDLAAEPSRVEAVRAEARAECAGLARAHEDCHDHEEDGGLPCCGPQIAEVILAGVKT